MKNKDSLLTNLAMSDVFNTHYAKLGLRTDLIMKEKGIFGLDSSPENLEFKLYMRTLIQEAIESLDNLLQFLPEENVEMPAVKAVPAVLNKRKR